MTRYVDTRKPPLCWLAPMGLLLLAACSTPPLREERAALATDSRAASTATPATAGSAQARFEAALKLMQDGQREAAGQALQTLCRDYPNFSGPCTDLGIVYAKMQRRDAAIAAFSEASRRNPDNVVALNWLGLLYREAGDYTRAEQAYQQAMRARPDDAAAYLNLAILYDLSLHRQQEALAQYRLYLQHSGSQPRPMVGVWIREIETASGGSGARAVAGAQK